MERNSTRIVKIAAWRYAAAIVRVWAGRQIAAPHYVKAARIRRMAAQYRSRHFIETGTCLGDTVAAVQDMFDDLVSIELDPLLFVEAVIRFDSCPDVSIYYGDSAAVFPLLPKRPYTLYWLDGHYSGGVTARGDTVTPIITELRSLRDVVNSVIMVDDSRMYTGRDGWPSLEELRAAIGPRARNEDVVDDIIHYTMEE